MYSLTNSEDPVRPNRVSAYAFNPQGGEGSGSYFQDPVTVDQWMMVDMVISTSSSPTFPTGFVKIYKNGVLRGTEGLNQFGVVPEVGNAPFRVGTTRLDSFFQGDIGKVAEFNYESSPADILKTYTTMYP